MRYALLICNDETAVISPEERSVRFAAFTAFAEQMRARGVLLGGEPLRPTTTATTVRVRDGDLVIADGPFAETKEQIGVSLPDVPAGASQREMTRVVDHRADGARYNFDKEPFAPEMPGLSAFALEDGVVYSTYSCYARGLDAFNSAYQLLDRTPNGRDEDDLVMPFAWVRRRDEYEPRRVGKVRQSL